VRSCNRRGAVGVGMATAMGMATMPRNLPLLSAAGVFMGGLPTAFFSSAEKAGGPANYGRDSDCRAGPAHVFASAIKGGRASVERLLPIGLSLASAARG
jgi:hypothetical protein